jgi:hypothetical protein
MVEKRKRKDGDGAAPRQPPRQVVQSAAPLPARTEADNMKKLITVRLDSQRGGLAERLRLLVSALRNLLPNFRKTVADFQTGSNKKPAKADARSALTQLTDSPLIQNMAHDDKLNNKEFIAAVLDYAQESLGLPVNPKASAVALVENKEDGTVDILCHKLNELGMYPDRWPIPLTPAGMKKKNRPKSRGEDAPVEELKAVKEEEKPLPTENRNQNRKKKKSTKLLEEDQEEAGTFGLRDSASHGGAVSSKLPETAVTTSAIDGKVTFLVGTGGGNQLKNLKNFVNGLKIILPQGADKLDRAAGLSKEAAYKEINSILGRIVPQVDDEAVSHSADYYRKFIIWAVEALDGTNGSEVANASVIVDGFQGRMVPAEWKKAGKLNTKTDVVKK